MNRKGWIDGWLLRGPRDERAGGAGTDRQRHHPPAGGRRQRSRRSRHAGADLDRPRRGPPSDQGHPAAHGPAVWGEPRPAVAAGRPTGRLLGGADPPGLDRLGRSRPIHRPHPPGRRDPRAFGWIGAGGQAGRRRRRRRGGRARLGGRRPRVGAGRQPPAGAGRRRRGSPRSGARRRWDRRRPRARGRPRTRCRRRLDRDAVPAGHRGPRASRLPGRDSPGRRNRHRLRRGLRRRVDRMLRTGCCATARCVAGKRPGSHHPVPARARANWSP